MKWALAFATARVLAEKIEFLEVPYNVCSYSYFIFSKILATLDAGSLSL